MTDIDIINTILKEDKENNRIPDNNNINPDPNFTFEINLEKNVDTIRERDLNGQFNINTKNEEIKNKYENSVENLLKEREMLDNQYNSNDNENSFINTKEVNNINSDTELDLNVNDFNSFLE